MKKLIFLMFVVFASGCASTPKQRYISFWAKDGISYEFAVTIHAECEYKALDAFAASHQKINMEYFKEQSTSACMKSKGYRWGKYQQ